MYLCWVYDGDLYSIRHRLGVGSVARGAPSVLAQRQVPE